MTGQIGWVLRLREQRQTVALEQFVQEGQIGRHQRHAHRHRLEHEARKRGLPHRQAIRQHANVAFRQKRVNRNATDQLNLLGHARFGDGAANQPGITQPAPGQGQSSVWVRPTNGRQGAHQQFNPLDVVEVADVANPGALASRPLGHW